ncbi:MAG: AI-2E family transporter [Alphaproteobacteria bacterium]|nr:AI-2E family transporter [Alphaproteobacteria bacterium]
MMALERQVTFWIAALAVFIAVLWLLSEMLLPFIAGMALAYLLDPIARRAQTLGIPRAVSALVMVTLVIVLLVVAVMAAAPIVGQQYVALLNKLPGYVDRLQSLVADPSQSWLGSVLGEQLPDAKKSVGSLVSQGAGFVTGFLGSLWSGGRAVLSMLSLLVITPVVAFYLLCDWERFVVTVDSWIPLQHRDTVRGLARDIDNAIAGFVRGQAVICLILAVFYAAGLTLSGLHFGFLIGLVTGLLSFIPYVGALTGFLVAGIVAIASFWPEWTPILMVAGVFGIGQVLEGYVLSPNLVGAKVGLHPVWMMFALIAFGYLFGFAGLLVAIPLAATIGVLLRFGLRQYLQSQIYTGRQPDIGPR